MSQSLETLNGSTRVHFIVGDPIAQVKSPAGVTQAFASRGLNAICVPAHVAPAQLADWVRGASLAQNVDGIIVTVPHKLAVSKLCGSLSDAAAFLQSVNTMRRNPDGSWHGDMFDGTGFVAALQEKGCQLAGKRVLLVGAGGAGSAIAYTLAVSGVAELAITEPDAQRRDSLIARLQGLGKAKVVAGNYDPTGFDVVLNATPVGMKESDPYPLEVDKLTADMFCGCVITAPPVTPFIAAAQAKGCGTMGGADMFAKVRDLMIAFLLRESA